MTLYHYSANPFTLDRSFVYRDSFGRRRFDKPDGLWVSVKGEDDWPSWCQSEGYALSSLRHETEVLVTMDNILVLESAKDVREFSRTYGFDSEHILYSIGIEWHKVIAEYSGIIIAPYQWDCRLDEETSWYYSWDCASGCIWNLDAIEKTLP